MSLASRRKPGRPPNVIPTVDWKVHIPIPIAAKIDILLLDPVTGGSRHGARSAFVTELLVQYLSQRSITVDPKGGDSHGN